MKTLWVALTLVALAKAGLCASPAAAGANVASSSAPAQLLLPPAAPAQHPDDDMAAALASEHASADVLGMMRWIRSSGDNQRMAFAVVDKKDARLFVFSPEGRLVGASPALLGLARGDHSVPGIGERELSKILPHERTTPAGRFASEPGQNLTGEPVVWIDYDAALAIHRLRPAPTWEKRPQRLASTEPGDNRISLGCVIVDGEFYDRVVAPTLGHARGVVYVLPETQPLAAVFGARRVAADQAAADQSPQTR